MIETVTRFRKKKNALVLGHTAAKAIVNTAVPKQPQIAQGSNVNYDPCSVPALGRLSLHAAFLGYDKDALMETR